MSHYLNNLYMSQIFLLLPLLVLTLSTKVCYYLIYTVVIWCMVKATGLRGWDCYRYKMSNKRWKYFTRKNQLCCLCVTSAWQCFLSMSVMLALPLSVGVFVCIHVCVACLSGCWTNSREIILPQSLSLSGQSDEEQVIFNTAGGLLKYQRSQTPCLRVQEPISLLPLFPSSVYSFSHWDHSKWLGSDREICSADNALKKCGDKLDRADNGQI